MSVRDQDHAGVAMAVAVGPGDLNQTLDLALGEMLALRNSEFFRRRGIRRFGTTSSRRSGKTLLMIMPFAAWPGGGARSRGR
jgi:hypothetical protein